MPIKCNIDSRGRTLRIIVGALIEGPGWLILALRFAGVISGEWPWVVGGILALLGTVIIVQGVVGWCAVKAMGIGDAQEQG